MQAPALAPKDAIRAKAIEAGFDAVGFASARLDPAHGQALRRFVDEGRHGQMAWLEGRQDERASPDGLWPQARSVVVLGLNYAQGQPPELAPDDCGTISCYAQNKDYHDLVKKRLKVLARWMAGTFDCDVKVFVDTAPVMEKPLAQQAGLGWQGKHTNLVSREFGSWLVLGEVFTTLELEPDRAEVDHCGSCRACLDACPTGALEPYRMDARKCISYLTIEHKGAIDPDLASRMDNRVYGCDACLAACPWTKFTKPAHEPWFEPRAELTAPRLDQLSILDDVAFRRLFSGSPVRRCKVDGFLRNVAIAKANARSGTSRS